MRTPQPSRAATNITFAVVWIGPRLRLLAVSLLAALAAGSAAAQPSVKCSADEDCGEGYACVAQKTACASHPESSTCVERICRRQPGGPIKDADFFCDADADCAVVVFDFHCMYCAREGDYENGVAAAVNKDRAKYYEPKPTLKQKQSCMMAGPCAVTGESRAACREHRCELEYRARGEEPAAAQDGIDVEDTFHEECSRAACPMLARINGRTYRVGDVINGAKIIVISYYAVTFDDHGRRFEKRVKRP